MNTANSSDMVRVCEICGEDYKPAGWAQRRCIECCSKYRHNSKRLREKKRHRGKRVYPDNSEWRLNYRLKQFELSREQYEVWKLAGCALCGQPFTEESVPHIDHDHQHCAGKHGCVKCVRGLLCHSCNQQFIAAVESNVRLRDLVSPRVVAYIDSKRETGIGSST